MWLWCVQHINVSIFQIPLHGVQRLSVVLPDGASTPAARALRPPGPFPHAGGAKSGGSCRPGPQLEGGAHDASDPHNAHISLSWKKRTTDSIRAHAVFIELINVRWIYDHSFMALQLLYSATRVKHMFVFKVFYHELWSWHLKSQFSLFLCLSPCIWGCTGGSMV